LLGNVGSLPRNAAASYTDPLSGDPALLVHLADGRFVAYDAVCTHAGCTVEYDSTQQQLVCPCHGATFDPAGGAQVVAGPAPQPLAPLTVQIDAQGNARAAGKA
jgi:thiosulfate dehydrogenase [quinone] large subunit